ncbi:hypothetical protein BAUCODRAFT_161061 [Baudoinia panamericana UAMH 10762]|uniref:Ubiquitin-like protease family profile domain-containing protein n=1 Tax=Baudoinia panamericana (strain UAMH 10762) TaxID=717646 RepID=M2MIE6_BAUPA|nr:uncharacterized protein BAUCODRAFT_161061 [Baudoinia panamericana UAMH 10762]EMC91038.1 hypothetical protein BAUCODRAFT_161061 [Baudoinia panamericana UAMH 10762]
MTSLAAAVHSLNQSIQRGRSEALEQLRRIGTILVSGGPDSPGQLTRTLDPQTTALLAHFITSQLPSQTRKHINYLTHSLECPWTISAAELYALFGKAVSSERFLRGLREVSQQCDDFPRAFMSLRAHQQQRMQGVPKRGTSGTAEWQPADTQAVAAEFAQTGTSTASSTALLPSAMDVDEATCQIPSTITGRPSVTARKQHEDTGNCATFVASLRANASGGEVTRTVGASKEEDEATEQSVELGRGDASAKADRSSPNSVDDRIPAYSDDDGDSAQWQPVETGATFHDTNSEVADMRTTIETFLQHRNPHGRNVLVSIDGEKEIDPCKAVATAVDIKPNSRNTEDRVDQGEVTLPVSRKRSRTRCSPERSPKRRLIENGFSTPPQSLVGTVTPTHRATSPKLHDDAPHIDMSANEATSIEEVSDTESKRGPSPGRQPYDRFRAEPLDAPISRVCQEPGDVNTAINPEPLCFRTGRPVPSHEDRLKVLQTLQPDAWLSTSSMHLLLDALNPDPDHVHVVDCGVAGSGKVRSRYQPLRNDLRRIILPMCLNENHWTLGMLDLETKCAFVFDPMNRQAALTSTSNNLRAFASCITAVEALQWKTFQMLPAQADMTNCGIYTIVCAMHWLHKEHCLRQPDANVWRRALSHAVSASLTPEDELQPPISMSVPPFEGAPISYNDTAVNTLNRSLVDLKTQLVDLEERSERFAKLRTAVQQVERIAEMALEVQARRIPHPLLSHAASTYEAAISLPEKDPLRPEGITWQYFRRLNATSTMEKNGLSFLRALMAQVKFDATFYDRELQAMDARRTDTLDDLRKVNISIADLLHTATFAPDKIQASVTDASVGQYIAAVCS